MEDLDTWLDRVYQADGNHAMLDALYDQWAQDYDQQIWASGNPYIAITAGFAGKLIADFDARILDAGCGTGNMAQILHQMGYRNIDGLDPSAGMLKVAGSKQIYQSQYQLYLNKPLILQPFPMLSHFLNQFLTKIYLWDLHYLKLAAKFH